MRELLKKTMVEFGSIEKKETDVKKSVWAGKGLNIRVFGDTELKAKITKIEQTGLVTIKFSKPLLEIKNVTSIDFSVLNITVLSPYPNEMRDLNIT